MKTTTGRDPPTDHRRAQIAPRLYTDAPIREIIQFILKNYLNNKVMKTTVVNSNLNGKTNSNVTAKAGSTTQTPPNPQSGIAPSKTFDSGNGRKDDEPKKSESPATATEQPKAEQPKAEAVKTEAPKAEEQPKAEATKAEIKQALAEHRPAMNLEQALKWVETMHRRKIHRDKLVETISTLDAFEVAQMDDAEETGTNHFQGCELTIEDDSRKQFSTKNPFIIKAVAEYVKTLCVDKLAEIEGEIVIPA